MNNNINSIKESLKNIIGRIFLVDTVQLTEDYCNRELLDSDIGFKSRDLLRLYFEVEKQFKISIPENDILLGNFNTINNIANIVYRQINIVGRCINNLTNEVDRV